MVYADTGKLNLKSLIQTRRLLYLWHINNREESELINRIYSTQKIAYNTGDWVKLVESDKSELGITLSDKEIVRIYSNILQAREELEISRRSD